MTFIEYKDYERRVARFFKVEGINCLSDKDECVEPSFSHNNCDCCKRDLAGDRYDMAGYNPETEDIIEYSICVDCRYYSAYGQLDDMTMMEIGKNEQRPKTSNGSLDDDGDVWGSNSAFFRT